MAALVCRYQLNIIIVGFWSFVLLASTINAANSSDISIGQNIYNNGILANGEKITAIVATDVPILSTQLNCQKCHGRSGMGGIEGKYVIPPIAGQFLYIPSPQTKRPAYSRESLTIALRTGLDSAGRVLDPIMPRYNLSDEEIDALANFMEGQLVGQSPGLDDKTIHLATVIADDVEKDKRDAVLNVLERFIANKNSQTRQESERYNRGLTPASKLPTLYRKWEHHIWTLSGPKESWPAQLERYYKQTPVFILLGGLSSGSWSPMSIFCEKNKIPCLFPSTDSPDYEESDYYTRYFSRGLELEADLIASHINNEPISSSIIQVYCSSLSTVVPKTLRTKIKNKSKVIVDLVFNCDNSFPLSELKSQLDKQPDSTIVLWQNHSKIKALENNLSSVKRLYVSSTLLELDLKELHFANQFPVFAAHPYHLPGNFDPPFMRFKLWAKIRGITIRYPRLQAEAFFACFAARDALKHIRRYRLREYAVEMLDHSQSLHNYVPFHAQPSMGPGQAFLTKGGYIIPFEKGQPANKNAIWFQP